MFLRHLLFHKSSQNQLCLSGIYFFTKVVRTKQHTGVLFILMPQKLPIISSKLSDYWQKNILEDVCTEESVQLGLI